MPASTAHASHLPVPDLGDLSVDGVDHHEGVGRLNGIRPGGVQVQVDIVGGASMSVPGGATPTRAEGAGLAIDRAGCWDGSGGALLGWWGWGWGRPGTQSRITLHGRIYPEDACHSSTCAQLASSGNTRNVFNFPIPSVCASGDADELSTGMRRQDTPCFLLNHHFCWLSMVALLYCTGHLLHLDPGYIDIFCESGAAEEQLRNFMGLTMAGGLLSEGRDIPIGVVALISSAMLVCTQGRPRTTGRA